MNIEENRYIIDGEYLCNYENLVKNLIAEIKRDTLENNEDTTIVSNNMELLEQVYSKRNNCCLQNEEFIINELSLFGYSIVKVKDIESNLITLKHYLNNINQEVLAKDTEHLKQEIEEIFK